MRRAGRDGSLAEGIEGRADGIRLVLAEEAAGTEGAAVCGDRPREDGFGAGGVRGRVPGCHVALGGEEKGMLRESWDFVAAVVIGAARAMIGAAIFLVLLSFLIDITTFLVGIDMPPPDNPDEAARAVGAFVFTCLLIVGIAGGIGGLVRWNDER